MRRIVSFAHDRIKYVAYVYLSAVELYVYCPEAYDFKLISIIREEIEVLDACLTSNQSCVLAVAVVVATGLRIYEYSKQTSEGNSTPPILVHNIDFSWPSATSTCVRWGTNNSVVIGNGPVLHMADLDNPEQKSPQPCTITFAGGVNIEAIRSDKHDIDMIFELPGPVDSRVLIRKSRMTNTQHILWCFVTPDPTKLEAVWELSTMSTTAVYCCSTSRQSLYCIAGGVLSRFDRHGFSWSCNLDQISGVSCGQAVSIVLLSPEAAPSADSGAISNKFLVGFYDKNKDCPSSYATLFVREHCSKLRNGALVRVSLASLTMKRRLCSPFVISGMDIDFGFRPWRQHNSYLPSATYIVPVGGGSFEDNEYDLVLAAHPSFGSTFLIMRNVQAGVTESKLLSGAGYPSSFLDKIAYPSHMMELRDICSMAKPFGYFSLTYSVADRLVVGCTDDHGLGSALYRLDEGFSLESLMHNNEASDPAPVFSECAFDLGPAAFDVSLSSGDITILSSRSTRVSLAVRLDASSGKMEYLECNNTALESEEFTVGGFKVNSEIFVQVTTSQVIFMDSTSLTLKKRLSKSDLIITDNILFAMLDIVPIYDVTGKKTDHAVLCLGSHSTVTVVLVPLSTSSGGLPLSYRVISKRCRNVVSAMGSTCMMGINGRKSDFCFADEESGAADSVETANFLLGVAMWDENEVLVLSLTPDGSSIIRVHEVATATDQTIRGLSFSSYVTKVDDNRESTALVSLWCHTDDSIGVCNYIGRKSKDGNRKFSVRCEGNVVDRKGEGETGKTKNEFQRIDVHGDGISELQGIDFSKVVPRGSEVGITCMVAWTNLSGIFFHIRLGEQNTDSHLDLCEIGYDRIFIEAHHGCCPCIYYENECCDEFEEQSSTQEKILKSLNFLFLQKEFSDDGSLPSGIVHLGRSRISRRSRSHCVKRFAHVPGKILSLRSLGSDKWIPGGGSSSCDAIHRRGGDEYFICAYTPLGRSVNDGVSIGIYRTSDLSCLFTFENSKSYRLECNKGNNNTEYSYPIGAIPLPSSIADVCGLTHSGITFAVCFRNSSVQGVKNDIQENDRASVVVFTLVYTADLDMKVLTLGSVDQFNVSGFPELNRPLKPTELHMSCLGATTYFACASYGKMSLLRRNNALQADDGKLLSSVSSISISPQHAPVIGMACTGRSIVLSVAFMGLQIFSFSDRTATLEPLYFLDLGEKMLLQELKVLSCSVDSSDDLVDAREEIVIACNERVGDGIIFLHVPSATGTSDESTVLRYEPILDDKLMPHMDVLSLRRTHDRSRVQTNNSSRKGSTDLCWIGNNAEEWKTISGEQGVVAAMAVQVDDFGKFALLPS